MDTIFALASAAGRAGVAVYRLSGPAASDALLRLGAKAVPAPRKAQRIRLSYQGEDVDDGLALYFPAPHSFTGEDVVELHLHGGRAVARAVTKALTELGLRPADPGEFSKRAFLAGKLDLTQAEAIADLVDAETSQQRRQALRQLDGGLTQVIGQWRDRLIRALGLTEAAIDFSDEGIPDGVQDQAAGLVTDLLADMTRQLDQDHRGERLRDGLHVAILGAPNAGKSSLLNRLAGREAAIVSSQAGTTRDIIEIHLDLGGWPVILADTAGLREQACEIEAQGIARALARAEQADLKILVFDASALPHLDQRTLSMIDDKSLVVINKADLWQGQDLPCLSCPMIVISAKSGQGIEDLLAALTEAAGQSLDGAQSLVLTRARHVQAVKDCVSALIGFSQQGEIDLAAEELRQGLYALARVTGQVDMDEVLDVVFREFCIGK